ncbi:hypothetical protein [Streptomyces prasinopilosus]|uniref:Uncharacterized protein n=1 Tax=Streptomyces prasinopilosus TaxID=67344 RepID=A0A1G6XDB7_9ACTN|nr:hypothetical protein [Streptomyces prasinopilosus]SDD76209.1 hypothetical protein SAMN05216505_111184 [Streptomyces prasinopilosus]
MDGGWTGLVVAVVGVVGTLGAALLTQNRADRTRQCGGSPPAAMVRWLPAGRC